MPSSVFISVHIYDNCNQFWLINIIDYLPLAVDYECMISSVMRFGKGADN